MQTGSDNVAVMRAFADPIRQTLLRVLIEEELSVGELVDILRAPQSTVSRHLGVLRRAGLVRDRRNGTTTLYKPSLTANACDAAEPSAMLLNWLGRIPLPEPLDQRLREALTARQQKAMKFFTRLGHHWDELRADAFGDAFALEAFLAFLPREWTVADVGTGTGFLLPVLAEHFARVVAIDPAPAMLACARDRVHAVGVANVELREGELERLPLDDQVCDLAIACLVLHHVARPKAAILEMQRILRSGGRVLLVEQAPHGNAKFHEAMQDLWWGFEPADLAKQLTEAGFQQVRHGSLGAAKQKAASSGAPSIFVMTGQKPAG